MAGTTKIILVRRPQMNVVDANGDTTGTDAADFIEITMDRFGKGTNVQVFQFPFADHAGLQAEWEAGTATTVLDAVVAAAMAGLAWETSELTTAQRAYIATIY